MGKWILILGAVAVVGYYIFFATPGERDKAVDKVKAQTKGAVNSVRNTATTISDVAGQAADAVGSVSEGAAEGASSLGGQRIKAPGRGK